MIRNIFIITVEKTNNNIYNNISEKYRRKEDDYEESKNSNNTYNFDYVDKCVFTDCDIC